MAALVGFANVIVAMNALLCHLVCLTGIRRAAVAYIKKKYPSDLTGLVFGGLTVIERDNPCIHPSGQKASKWRCRCTCGKEVSVLRTNLISGATKGCGSSLYGDHPSAHERQAKREKEMEEYKETMRLYAEKKMRLKSKYEEILGMEIDNPYNVVHMDGNRNNYDVNNLWYTDDSVMVSRRLHANKFCGNDTNDLQSMRAMCGRMYIRLVDRLKEVENQRRG